MLKCVGRITWSKHAHAQSQFCEFWNKVPLWNLNSTFIRQVKTDLWHPYYSFLLYARVVLAWMKKKPEKKRSLRMRNLKQTELQRLKNRWKKCWGWDAKKNRARRITQKLQEENKRSSETEDHDKQRLATLKRLKRMLDDNELRLEKVVARLAVETEEERRARLEKMVATKRLRLAMEMDEERKPDWRRWYLPHRSGWPWRQKKKEEQKMDWMNWI